MRKDTPHSFMKASMFPSSRTINQSPVKSGRSGRADLHRSSEAALSVFNSSLTAFSSAAGEPEAGAGASREAPGGAAARQLASSTETSSADADSSQRVVSSSSSAATRRSVSLTLASDDGAAAATSGARVVGLCAKDPSSSRAVGPGSASSSLTHAELAAASPWTHMQQNVPFILWIISAILWGAGVGRKPTQKSRQGGGKT
mmetsp:Transcript_138272/g.359343  ORF Transcript_138272/g.359343 Transcript_138272/m.359343 type:complete len:202 (-) Transcript_138272:2-607(-)